jgi:HK97 family phage portal protein
VTFLDRIRAAAWRLMGRPPMADPAMASSGDVPLVSGIDGYASFGDWNPWSKHANPIAAFYDFFEINPWVKSVCNKIAGEALNDGYQVVDKTTKDGTHPSMAALSAWLSATDFDGLRQEAILDLTICLNAFYFIQRNGWGQVTKLIRIAPQTIKPIGSADKGITAWKQTVGNKSKIYQVDQILHIKGPNPISDLIGLPILTAVATDVEADNAMAQFNRSYFGNGTQAGTILTWDQGDLRNPKSGEWTDNDEKKATNLWAQMTSYIERRFQNPTSAHLPLLLRGKWNVTGTGQAKADAQFLDGRKFNARTVCAVYGFPIEALGLGDRGAFGANLADPAAEQLDNCVTSFENLFDRQFKTNFLIKHLGIVGLETAPTPRPAKLTLTAAQAALTLARTGQHTRNEIRAVTKHARTAEGGDEFVFVGAAGVTVQDDVAQPETPTA